ncbi:hypothetical protein CPC197_0956, partial [Chlamydia psittaci C1/97]
MPWRKPIETIFPSSRQRKIV